MRKINLVGFADMENDGLDVGNEAKVTGQAQNVCLNTPADYYIFSAADARRIATALWERADNVDHQGLCQPVEPALQTDDNQPGTAS